MAGALFSLSAGGVILQHLLLLSFLVLCYMTV